MKIEATSSSVNAVQKEVHVRDVWGPSLGWRGHEGASTTQTVGAYKWWPWLIGRERRGKSSKSQIAQIISVESLDWLFDSIPAGWPHPLPSSPSSSNPSLTSFPPPYSLSLCPSHSVWFRHLFLQRVWIFPSLSPPVSWRQNEPRHSSIRLRWMISLSGKWRVIFETLSRQCWRLQQPESEGLSGTKEDSGWFCLRSVFDAVGDWQNRFCLGVSITLVFL